MLINDIFYNNPLSVFETKKLKKALTVKNWRGLDSEKLIFYYCYFCNDVFAKKEIGKVALEKLQLEDISELEKSKYSRLKNTHGGKIKKLRKI